MASQVSENSFVSPPQDKRQRIEESVASSQSSTDRIWSVNPELRAILSSQSFVSLPSPLSEQQRRVVVSRIEMSAADAPVIALQQLAERIEESPVTQVLRSFNSFVSAPQAAEDEIRLLANSRIGMSSNETLPSPSNSPILQRQLERVISPFVIQDPAESLHTQGRGALLEKNYGKPAGFFSDAMQLRNDLKSKVLYCLASIANGHKDFSLETLKTALKTFCAGKELSLFHLPDVEVDCLVLEAELCKVRADLLEKVQRMDLFTAHEHLQQIKISDRLKPTVALCKAIHHMQCGNFGDAEKELKDAWKMESLSDLDVIYLQSYLSLLHAATGNMREALVQIDMMNETIQQAMAKF